MLCRCIAGYYCNNGTETIDPLRNDTTLRPYPCTPGTYCLSGVGYSNVKLGDFLYAQNCTEGFYCEAASNSPRGSGLCPPGKDLHLIRSHRIRSHLISTLTRADGRTSGYSNLPLTLPLSITVHPLYVCTYLHG